MPTVRQAIARIYRFGQTRPSYVYRLLYGATLEELIYDRNLDKEELFAKVWNPGHTTRRRTAGASAFGARLRTPLSHWGVTRTHRHRDAFDLYVVDRSSSKTTSYSSCSDKAAGTFTDKAIRYSVVCNP